MITKRFHVQVAVRGASGYLGLVRRADDVGHTHVVYATGVDQAAQAMALDTGAIGWDYVEFSWEEWHTEFGADPTWFMPEADTVFFISETP